MKTIGLTVLMATGSNAVNPCLDIDLSVVSQVYPTSGNTWHTVNLDNCGLTDADHDDIQSFFDDVGRDRIMWLDVSFNSFTFLPDNFMDGIKPTSFRANNNDLTTLPVEVFRNNNMKYVYLEDNKLAYLPPNVFSTLDNYRFYITGNPLICMPEVGEWATSHESFVDDGVPSCEGVKCSNDFYGFEGSNNGGSTCCPLQCGGCGGQGCENYGSDLGMDMTDCCVVQIQSTQPACSETTEAPCYIEDNTGSIVAASMGSDGSYMEEDASSASRALLVQSGGFAAFCGIMVVMGLALVV